MNKPRYLTKSRFKLAVECPTKLFYTGKREYRDTMVDDDFLKMLAEGGYQVGALAKCLYPQGHEINTHDHEEALSKTSEYLKQDHVVLFEPAFRFENFFIRADILIKSGNRYELIEVKAKSYNSLDPKIEGKRGGVSSQMLPYLQDVAFQSWVISQAIPNSEISPFLMMPDKAKHCSIDGLSQMFQVIPKDKSCCIELNIPTDINIKKIAENLLAKVSVDKYVNHILANPIDYPGGKGPLSKVATEWAKAYSEDRWIAPTIGEHCGKCQFKAPLGSELKSGFHECWKQANDWKKQWVEEDFRDGTILDLWNFRNKNGLIAQHKLKLSQVLKEDIGDFEEAPDISGLSRKQRQWLQISGIPKAYDHGGFYFDNSLVSVEMSKWNFPYHFIDFETAAVALPYYRDMRPYESLAFQFSHHIMDSDGKVRHADQFLCAQPGVFPNYDFARFLKKVLENDNGTVFMWHHHENSILNNIIDQLNEDPRRPDDANELIAFLRTLVKEGGRAMYDLRVLAEKAFYHPDTKGSNSIKKVLPATIKVSEFLKHTYSKPIYGNSKCIQSLNFKDEKGFIWIESNNDGETIDPYKLLEKYAKDMLPIGVENVPEGEASYIADGGAAATAYARLQSKSLDPGSRERIENALLRYCELDTLAMVMIVQAWREVICGLANVVADHK